MDHLQRIVCTALTMHLHLTYKGHFTGFHQEIDPPQNSNFHIQGMGSWTQSVYLVDFIVDHTPSQTLRSRFEVQFVARAFHTAAIWTWNELQIHIVGHYRKQLQETTKNYICLTLHITNHHRLSWRLRLDVSTRLTL